MKKSTTSSKAPRRVYRKKALPKTARAYLGSLGFDFATESAAVAELVKLHNSASQKPASANPDPETNVYVFTKPGEPIVDDSLWGRFKGWFNK